MNQGTALLADPTQQWRVTETAVEIVVPVYNEAADLGRSIGRLHRYLSEQFPLTWRVTIADNASTDATWPIACELACRLKGVRAVHLDRKGRGRALREVWSASTARVVAYMDVDLSTDLDALLPLVAPLVSGHSDVAIGTRLASGARVVRGPKREVISRSYNMLLKATMRSGFSDAQCGFKAVRSDVARVLLPMVEDQEWFFDTELLLLAEHNGLRIHEVPVDWVDDADSRVDVVGTAAADLRGIWRMLRRVATGRATIARSTTDSVETFDADLGGQLARFASIGVVSTIVFAVLFVALSGPLGRYGADVVALMLCSVANTAANRRLTFSLRGRSGRARHYLAGSVLAALPLALTLITLLTLRAAGTTSLVTALVALAAINAVATVMRFVLLRSWVFRPASERGG
jgi:putative flippase GtrA